MHAYMRIHMLSGTTDCMERKHAYPGLSLGLVGGRWRQSYEEHMQGTCSDSTRPFSPCFRCCSVGPLGTSNCPANRKGMHYSIMHPWVDNQWAMGRGFIYRSLLYPRIRYLHLCYNWRHHCFSHRKIHTSEFEHRLLQHKIS